jgi:integrase/recombinase XerD
MQLLHAGIGTSVIALWLGHKSPKTTQIYLLADLALKEHALARTTLPDVTPGRCTPPDTVHAFLEALPNLNTRVDSRHPLSKHLWQLGW